MEISKLHISISGNELSERALPLLRQKVPEFVSIESVVLEGGTIGISGAVDKLGKRTFSIKFKLALAEDGRAILLKLHDADISNTWWIPMSDINVINKVLADSIPQMPGLSYSGDDKQLEIEPSKLVASFGIEFTAKAASLSFDKGIDIDFCPAT